MEKNTKKNWNLHSLCAYVEVKCILKINEG